MKFYKVKPEADGVRRWKWCNGYIQPYGEYVANELLKERELLNEVYHEKHKDQIMEIVNVPIRKTYYFFGVRFMTEE